MLLINKIFKLSYIFFNVKQYYFYLSNLVSNNIQNTKIEFYIYEFKSNFNSSLKLINFVFYLNKHSVFINTNSVY